MTRMPDEPSDVLLDACVVINLYATGRMPSALHDPGRSFTVAQFVADEALYVRRGGHGEDADDHEPVDLSAVIEQGLLRVLEPTEAELATFVELALELDDGEAMTIALAIHRRIVVVTDDRKARRVAASHGVALLTTLEIVKEWAEREQLSLNELRHVLVSIRERATYWPARQHPLREWWGALVEPE